MKRYLKWAWALATLALFVAGYYEYWYFLLGVASGAFWWYVYFYSDRGDA